MREFLGTVICIVIFALVMSIMKYSVAPYIAGTYGLIGIIVFVGGCYLFAVFFEKNNRR